MPNQLAVVRSLRQDVIGPNHHYRYGEIATMPSEPYDDVTDAMAAILERVVVAVDWRRLLVEASWRHMHLHPDRKETLFRYQSEAKGVCGECLAEALLQENVGAPDWERQPEAELRHQGIDWAAVVAAVLPHRRGTIAHEYRTPHRGRAAGQPAAECHPHRYTGECPCPPNGHCCKVAPSDPTPAVGDEPAGMSSPDRTRIQGVASRCEAGECPSPLRK